MNANANTRRNAGRLAAAFAAAGTLIFAFAANSASAETEQTTRKADDNACVFFNTINDWRALDSRNLVIWAPGRRNAYHVTLGFPLHDLKSENSLALIDHNHDGLLCGYGMDEVVTSGAFRERSTIFGMTRLDEAGLAALGEQYKVQLLPKPRDGEDK